MYLDAAFKSAVAASQRAPWQIEDVIGDDDVLDFSRPFLPEALARTSSLTALDADERLLVNHIRAHEYLGIFGLVEEFILPFVLDHARPQLGDDDDRTRALLQFASEEAKHIQLFKRFHTAFEAGFGHACPLIGPPAEVARVVLGHDPLSVALTVLQIEWMTQAHYVESVRGDPDLDPLFKSLLRHHWIEEAMHARLDTLMVEALAQGRDADAIESAFAGFLEIVAYLDAGLAAQTEINLGIFERAAGRTLDSAGHGEFLAGQRQAARWTFLGSGMSHPRFRATLGQIAPAALARLDAVAPAYS